ncbi:PCMD domain-containing protein [Maribellus maritimus]|uniref:PCMD domain-containing protein n=1 Tax=Maribellus maritimus TaxID=2870838 RepID=UPI001EEAABE5|nr:PCMD domain-containing protein [Maribellus maritimus]MCG6187422.1 PCMD domain-containing protein [Maribellus maritimus]
MTQNQSILTFSLFFFLLIKSSFGQDKTSNVTGQLPCSNFDIWHFKECKESSLVGGETKKVFELGFENQENDNINEISPWGTTNIHAKLAVDIYNTCVFPEKNENGYSCRMETKVREIRVMGLKLKVLVSGALFLGEMEEPVRSVKNPIQKINHGIPFTERPRAIQFNYKYNAGKKRIKSIYNSEPIKGCDKAELCLLLQKRWEDEKGNVYATRIGGVRNFFDDTNNCWLKDTIIDIKYGDITNELFYDSATMGLIPSVSELYVKNSQGKMVPLIETGWDTKNENPTHLVLYFTSSYEGIEFIGSPESVLWVDDIQFVY